ncbi:MAG: dihydrofolate reductase [Ignavibacteriales bacterium]|nr:dihydrofolate reductase [Ignavibacteriales bacterium]
MEKIIIAAISENNVIGKDGKLPWQSKKELKHFREQTFGYPIIMGRKTYEGIGKELDGRLNIVISKNKKLNTKKESIIIFNNFEKAVDYCEKENFEKIYFIGGESIFREAIKIADKIILSKFYYSVEGDKLFPEIDQNIWKLGNKIMNNEEFTVNYYIRKN